MSLSTRLTAAMVLLVVLTAVAVGFLSYRNIEATFLPTELTRLDARARLQAANLNAHVAMARADALSGMGPSSLEGFVLSHAAGGADPRDGTREATWRERLVKNFAAQLATKPDYAQFRVIGVENNGRELIRVDHSGPDGAIRDVPNKELQQKADRDYFAQTLRLRQGEVYLSPIDLNQENGVILMPYMPVARVATPIFGPDGKLFGILIINVDMRPALAEIARSAGANGGVYVVNQDGDYLLNPNHEREFGFDLGQRYRLQDDYPELESALDSGQGVQRAVLNSSGRPILVALVPFRLADGPLISIVETIPVENALTSTAGVQRATLLGGFAAALVAALLAVWFARSLTRPLIQMTVSLSRFTGEEDVLVPDRASGEVGTLARAFTRMASAVREKTVALQHEIAERTRVEKRERLYIGAVELATDAILTSSLEGIITTWNAGAERMFGYTAGQAIGQPVALIADAERQSEQQENLHRMRSGERIQDVDTVRRAKDGSLRDVSLTLSPIADPKGELVGVSAIYRDIRPRKLAEERFQLAVEASPGAMIMSDRNGMIQLVNAEAERMFGYEKAELIGKPIETLIPAKLRSSHERDRKAFAVDPSRRQMGMGRDLFGVRKDGTEVAVEIGLNPIDSREGPMVMASIVDLTERKRHERLLAERAQELERSNAELEQFAYVASHDLQEPLRMVASYAELLAERYQGKLDAKADKYIGYAVDGAKRMQRLVNDLLAYSRVGRHQAAVGSTDMNQVLQEVLKNLQHVVQNASAKVEIGQLPVVVADEGQLAQVFQNLIGNALKFVSDSPPVVRIGAEAFGQGWKFSVEDNGIGIESGYSERIFQMFQRLHDRQSYEGNGIGLTIAKKIVERHGGRIWFESVLGRGTTFFFTLPQSQEKAA